MTLTATPPTGTRACPKCGNLAEVSILECPKCSVIIDKAVRAAADAAEVRESESHGWMGQLAAESQLSVRQQVERLEAWTGIETANAYAITNGLNVLLHAIEESGNVADFLVRNYLKSSRPFTMRVQALHGETAFVIDRPFRIYFSEVEVRDVLGKRIGSVKRKLSFPNRVYEVTGQRPGETYEIHGPLLRPWTFRIRRHGQECGKIAKRWSGLGRETFTDADKFGIEFPPGIGPALKAVFLGAVFLIDFVHFEDNN